VSCDEMLDPLSLLLDGRLPDADRGLVEAHLARCPDCEAVWEDLQACEELLAGVPALQPASAPLSLNPLLIEATVAAAALPDGGSPAGRFQPQRRLRWAAPLLLAAAAALLVWVASSLWTRPGPAAGPDGGPDQRHDTLAEGSPPDPTPAQVPGPDPGPRDRPGVTPLAVSIAGPSLTTAQGIALRSGLAQHMALVEPFAYQVALLDRRGDPAQELASLAALREQATSLELEARHAELQAAREALAATLPESRSYLDGAEALLTTYDQLQETGPQAVERLRRALDETEFLDRLALARDELGFQPGLVMGPHGVELAPPHGVLDRDVVHGEVDLHAFQAGHSSFANGDWAGAVDSFNTYQNANPQGPYLQDAQLLLAEANLYMGNYEDAALNYFAVLNEAPTTRAALGFCDAAGNLGTVLINGVAFDLEDPQVLADNMVANGAVEIRGETTIHLVRLDPNMPAFLLEDVWSLPPDLEVRTTRNAVGVRGTALDAERARLVAEDYGGNQRFEQLDLEAPVDDPQPGAR
jgi:TolA-binding protein/anti-sigma factor RsiW